MSFIDTKSKFHVALDGQGLILQGAPDRIAYQQGQAPLYGQRFASGDRSYNDLSSWWYFVQTSWAAGFKNITSWLDDAKFYYSSNIDSWSENGAIKLCREQYPSGSSGDNDFTYEIGSGFEGIVNNTLSKFVSTIDESDNRPHIYKASAGEDTAFTDISTTTISTSANVVSQMWANSGILWFNTSGVGANYVVGTWDGTTWTDQSAYIYNAGATISFQPASSRCGVSYLGVTYVFCDDAITANKYALVKTSVSNPSAAANWSKVFEITNTKALPVACAGYDGKIYYIIYTSPIAELWCYDITAATNNVVQRFTNVVFNTSGVGDKMFSNVAGKLVITIPDNEIWELSGSALTKIYTKDVFKSAGTNGYTPEINAYLYQGAVNQDNKAWWGNMMYDGTYFFNTWKNDADSTTNKPYPLFADSSLRIWETHTGDRSVLWSLNQNGSLYKGDADKNFLVFSNFDNISGIDKLAYSATILFSPLLSGQKIAVEYLTGELTPTATWTVLGSASYSVDGGVVTDKTLYFSSAIVFKKMWIRVKLESGGSNTPSMKDFVMEYLPVPSYKKNWTINVNCGDEVKTLSGRLVETTARELRGKLERSWWTKSVLDFQDLDYATTAISGGSLTSTNTTITVVSTRDFPEQGRLRIEDEEITYTGKTQSTFTGCTRGARSTRAVSHADTTVVNNAYKVIITDMSSRIPIALEGRELEYVMGISLREV